MTTNMTLKASGFNGAATTIAFNPSCKEGEIAKYVVSLINPAFFENNAKGTAPIFLGRGVRLGSVEKTPSITVTKAGESSLLLKIAEVVLRIMYFFYNPCGNYFKMENGKILPFTMKDSIDFTLSSSERAKYIEGMKEYLGEQIENIAENMDKMNKKFIQLKGKSSQEFQNNAVLAKNLVRSFDKQYQKISAVFDSDTQKTFELAIKQAGINAVLLCHADFLSLSVFKIVKEEFVSQIADIVNSEFNKNSDDLSALIKKLLESKEFRKKITNGLIDHLRQTLKSDPQSLSIFLEIGKEIGTLNELDLFLAPKLHTSIILKYLEGEFEKDLKKGSDLLSTALEENLESLASQVFGIMKEELSRHELSELLPQEGLTIGETLNTFFSFLRKESSNPLLGVIINEGVNELESRVNQIALDFEKPTKYGHLLEEAELTLNRLNDSGESEEELEAQLKALLHA